jgi:predicted DNA-binding transcriptional regulator AlpA
MHHLVGLNEIAEMLEISRARADQLARQVGFPPPEAVLSAGRIWSRSSIETWAQDAGRLLWIQATPEFLSAAVDIEQLTVEYEVIAPDGEIQNLLKEPGEAVAVKAGSSFRVRYVSPRGRGKWSKTGVTFSGPRS